MSVNFFVSVITLGISKCKIIIADRLDYYTYLILSTISKSIRNKNLIKQAKYMYTDAIK